MKDVRVIEGDCLGVLPTLEEGSADSCVTDPPYELGFMGKEWDGRGVAFDPATWEAVLRVLKPGGYLLAFGGTRTFHRLACAVEDAGFQIRDTLCWLYGQGFPKGRGCLKPGWEPIILARKPGRNVLPLQIDACRLGTTVETWPATRRHHGVTFGQCRGQEGQTQNTGDPPAGRWPANVCLDEEAAALLDLMSGWLHPPGTSRNGNGSLFGRGQGKSEQQTSFQDGGGASRFFFCPKASKADRGKDNDHSTVKPLELMRWLVRLITPPGGTVLDLFAGSGTTALACLAGDFRAVLIEREPEYVAIIKRRLALAEGPLFRRQEA